MALFARVAKLGSGPTARGTLELGRPLCSVISRQRNSGYTYKAEQVKYRGTRPLQFPPPFHSLALTHLSQKREVAQHLHLPHTVRQA